MTSQKTTCRIKNWKEDSSLSYEQRYAQIALEDKDYSDNYNRRLVIKFVLALIGTAIGIYLLWWVALIILMLMTMAKLGTKM